MAEITLPFPLKGKDDNFGLQEQTPLTSSYLMNVRPYDVQDKRCRGGQRPALRKLYTQQIGGAAARVEAITQITTV